MKSNILLITFFTSVSSLAFSQQATVAAGGVATGSGGSVSYSIGQVACSAVSGTTGSIIQGVQQPHELLITNIKETSSSFDASVYPNPAAESIRISLGTDPTEAMQCNLYDMAGKLVSTHRLSSRQLEMNLAELPVAAYTLQISNSQSTLKTFRVVKK